MQKWTTLIYIVRNEYSTTSIAIDNDTILYRTNHMPGLIAQKMMTQLHTLQNMYTIVKAMDNHNILQYTTYVR